MTTYKDTSWANLFPHLTIKKIATYASGTGDRGRFVIQKTHSGSCRLTGEYGCFQITLNRTRLVSDILIPNRIN